MKTLNKAALAIALLAAGMALGWGLAQWRSQPSAAVSEERKPLYWYDPMVPTQKFDKPGKSPFMDMQLVPKYAGEGDSGVAAVSVSPAALQSLGLRVTTVEKTRAGTRIDAVGTLQLNEREVSIVQARAAGFVERVYAHAPGDVLPAGAPLVDLLLPDWIATQREYLAVKALNDGPLTQAARQRLNLLGMPPALIEQLDRSGQTQGSTTVRVPAGGLLAELMVRQGMTVSAGMSLARINGLGSIWLEAAIPEAQAGAVQVGQAVEAQMAAYPGELFRGRVAAVLPQGNAETRTLRLRIELPNPGQRLKAGMFAQVGIQGLQSEALRVPAEAIIRTGKRAVAYVLDGPGRYRPVEVEVGAEQDGKLVVLRGLEAGQQVVASAQFLIDSEASLQGLMPVPAAGHSATGTVIELGEGSVTLAHAPVPALKWPAMQMDFKLVDARLRAGLKPRQVVQFSFVKQGDDYVVTAIQPADAASAAGGKP
ncbi:MAG: efflux RND transporter periplasmic adaptor subunit [Burkholderiaceae bacterium]|nr:efflux RND transporter periplasmic adaptor subunit [Burkholderiaceae bacterium]